MGKKTTYQISTSVNEGILEIVFTGEVTQYAVEKLHTEVITILKETNAKAVLSDVSALKGRFEEFAAAYFQVRKFPKDIIGLCSAVVDTSENEAYHTFYETTAANVGQTVKWFTDINAAREWLKSML
jgi:hypothetical protein